jgi:phosphoglycerate kinase
MTEVARSGLERVGTLADVDVAGKRVLVRVDFNVAIDKNTGEILDDFRIKQTCPTIERLRSHRARVILCSHMGRPGKEPRERLRMAVVGRRLSELLSAPVAVAPDCVGPEVEALVAKLGEGEVLLLENLRFHAGEEANDPAFARQLAALADVYVNDAFATSHRAHASVVGVADLVPVAVAGLLLEKEIGYLRRLVSDPRRPYGAIFGGGKIGDKIGILRRFLGIADVLVVGGGIANTLLKAQGRRVGKSLVDLKFLDEATRILQDAGARNVSLHLPSDVVVSKDPDDGSAARVVEADAVLDDDYILDIGPRSAAAFAGALSSCQTIIWNGPMGRFEVAPFAEGSRLLAEQLGRLKALRVAGGGDTSALNQELDLERYLDYVSTGGGAFLEYLEGLELPGITALARKR